MVSINPIKIGIIGLGAIGTRLMKEINSDYQEKIIITAICDANQGLAEKVAKDFGINHSYTSHSQLLGEADVDIIYIAVPPKYHEQVALDTIAAGKHILCEKPLANSLEQAKAMVNAANSSSIIHMMNFPLNYQPQMYKMMSLIESGYIGKIRRIDLVVHFPEWPRSWQKNSWVGKREQGGYILEVGAHWIQFIQKNFGRIDYIQGEVMYPNEDDLCETGVTANMKLNNGITVNINGLSQMAGDERVELMVHGTIGSLMIEKWGVLKGGKIGQPFEIIETDDVKVLRLFDQMINAIQGKKADLYDFKVGYNVQVVLEAFKDSNFSNGVDLSKNYL